jgi:hypothetical protein
MDMAKAAATTEKPKALDTLVEITETALDFRYADKTVKLMDIGKVVIQASRAMHIRDADERVQCENQAVMAIAKKRQLLS